jgi:cyanophycin synthetase
MLFPQGNGRIPIISVTGTNGKTTTVRLLSRLLQKQNLIVGMTSTEGIYINGQMISAGDLSGPHSAQVVLRHPEVQVAVLETARGGILKSGLGYDYADVAIVTNISEDHLGQYGIEDIEDLTKVKSLVAEAVKKHSYVILNADDNRVAVWLGERKGGLFTSAPSFRTGKSANTWPSGEPQLSWIKDGSVFATGKTVSISATSLKYL